MPKHSSPLGPAGSCLVLVMLVVACGGGPATAEPESTPTLSPNAFQAPNGSEIPTAQPANDNPVAKTLAWVIGLGPGAPEGPDEVDAYQLILEASEESCRAAHELEMDRSTELYHGAAAACLAALHGRSNRWPEAVAAFDSLGAPPDGCVDRQIHDLLEFAVSAYRANPNTSFRLERSHNTVASRCPRVDDVTVTRDSSAQLEVLVRGDRLGRALKIAYQYVEGCPVPVTTPVTKSVEPVDRTRELLRAAVGSEEGSARAAYIWVAVVAAPDPWVADARCVSILDGAPSDAPPADATPSP